MDYEGVFNGVTWETVSGKPETVGLYATHHGKGEIFGVPFRCYRLSDGRAVIHADDMHAIFEKICSGDDRE